MNHCVGPRSKGTRADRAVWGYVESMARSTVFDPHPVQPEIQADLQDVARQVRKEFADRIDLQQVNECLNRVAATFDGARVRSFVPLLVRRLVREELQASLSHA